MAFIEYKKKCIFHFCVLRTYLDDSFPSELINVINYHCGKYIFICKLPYICELEKGHYIITRALTCLDDVAINVTAKNVDIDMNGCTITGSNKNVCFMVNNKNCYIHGGIIENFLIFFNWY